MKVGLTQPLKGSKPLKADLDETKILYPPVNAYALKVNRKAYLQGVVPPSEEAQVLKQAKKVLKETFKAKTYSSQEVRAYGGSSTYRGGDLYLDLPRGLYPTSTFHPKGKLLSKVKDIETGSHGYDPRRKTMWATFYSLKPIPGVDPNKETLPMTEIAGKVLEALR